MAVRAAVEGAGIRRARAVNLANIQHVAACYGTAGRKGSGKTSRMVRYIQGRKFDFVFSFDPTGQLAQKFARPTVQRREAVLSAIGTGFCFYQPQAGDGQEFDWFADVVFTASEWLEGSKVFAVDEIQTWVDQYTMPPAFRTIADKGRWYRLDLAFTCQSFNTIHNGLRNQLTEVAAFAHSDATATRSLLDMGFGANELRDLRRGEYLTRTLDPFGPIRFGDDHRGVLEELPGQIPPASPLLERFRKKAGKSKL